MPGSHEGEVTASGSVGTLAVSSVSDQVYRRLRDAIVSGELSPGSTLRQESLARQLGVSRTPLREALMRLAAEGMVRLEANRGATVAEFDFGDWEMIWEARMAVEAAAAGLAARRRRPEDLARLAEALERQRHAVADVGEALEANRAFHLAVVELSGNPYLLHFARMLWSPPGALAYFGRQASEPPAAHWQQEHSAIAEAIAAGDAARAERLVREHIGSNPPPGHPPRPGRSAPPQGSGIQSSPAPSASRTTADPKPRR